ncbi:DUF1152 domain-containing protein [Nocardia sp. NPDC003345]
MAAIAIAAGGGGDAVTTAILGVKMPELGVAAIMSYSWDRLMVDPTPGPRTRADFEGLKDLGGVSEVSPRAVLRTEGQSTLPTLVHHIASPLLLIDPSAGTAGVAKQIRCAAAAFDAQSVIVVDVGGDILAQGHEPNLRSPLADSLALAAAVTSGLPVEVLVTGAGLDGELSTVEVDGLLRKLAAQDIAALDPADVAEFEAVWSWHPSEANGLLAAAAAGWRGLVETQRGSVVSLAEESVRVHRVDAGRLVDASLAKVLLSAATLAEAEAVVRARLGRSDIDIERQRRANWHAIAPAEGHALDTIDRYAEGAAERGIGALTARRVFELVGATTAETVRMLRGWLTARRPDRFQPPLYRCRG